MTITIPNSLTAAEIIKTCGNLTSKGIPVLYNVNWYKDEPFYTTETTRGGTYEVDKITHKNKDWNQCDVLATQEKKQMLTFAELLYVMVEHEKQTGEWFFGGWEYSWTSSRDSGGNLVSVGRFDSDGACVSCATPDHSRDDLGVCLSRMTSEPMQQEPLNPNERTASELEIRVAKLEQTLAAIKELL